jgi:anti-sigma factor RsiW
MSAPHCSEYELTAYHQRCLPPEDHDRVATHISACLTCTTTLADIGAAAELTDTLAHIHAPSDFSDRVMAHIVTAHGNADSAPRFTPALAFVRVVSWSLAGVAVLLVVCWLAGVRWEPGKQITIEPHHRIFHPSIPQPSPPSTTPEPRKKEDTQPPARTRPTPSGAVTPPSENSGDQAPVSIPHSTPPDGEIVRGPNPTGEEIRGPNDIPHPFTPALDPAGMDAVAQALLAALREDKATAQAASTQGIAVMPFAKTAGLKDLSVDVLEETVAATLSDGDALVESRRRVLDGLAGLGIPSGVSPDLAQARSVAHKLDIPLVILGDVSEAGKQVLIRLRCVNVTTGEVVLKNELRVNTVATPPAS